MHEVLGRPVEEPAPAAPAAAASSTTPTASVLVKGRPFAEAASGPTVSSHRPAPGGAFPAPAAASPARPAAAVQGNNRGRQTQWEVVSHAAAKQRARRREPQYVVGDDTLEADSGRRTAR